MSDLDAELRGLRDELNSAIPLPDVEHVTGRARARRRLQLGAIAAVVLVALAVPVLRALPADLPPAGPPSSSPTNFTLDFADPDHGYALGRTCIPDCAFRLYRTADGGRSWQPRDLPAPAHSKSGYFGSSLYVLGIDNVVIDRPSDQLWQQRIHSTDGGRTWQTVERWGPAESMPLAPTATLAGRCGNGFMVTPDCDVITSIDPGSGKTFTTIAQPPLEFTQMGPVATEGGKWWASGRDRNTNQWALSVSADGGRTWSTSEVAVDGTPSWDGLAVVERNGVMYATATTYRATLGVWRSTDDGRSWTRTWTPANGQQIPGVLGMPIAAGDGSLRLPTGTTTYVSTDQGHTFTRTGDEMFGMVTWTRAGYLRSRMNEFALSSDGLHWKEFTVR
ncbi:exo-alpha-sialidase [Actinophytocola sp.]|uniref:exo-alpha-sialidase n=1 Tax=Actinophytocola sp. TaxID=1872138 RepID=UPI002ED4590E